MKHLSFNTRTRTQSYTPTPSRLFVHARRPFFYACAGSDVRCRVTRGSIEHSFSFNTRSRMSRCSLSVTFVGTSKRGSRTPQAIPPNTRLEPLSSRCAASSSTSMEQHGGARPSGVESAWRLGQGRAEWCSVSNAFACARAQLQCARADGAKGRAEVAEAAHCCFTSQWFGCMSPAEGVHDHAGVVLQCCLRFDGGILPSLAACARIQRTRIECIGQETRRAFRLLFVATQSLHILRNMVHRVVKAAENMLRCRFIGTSPILLPQKRGVAPQKQRALRIWGRRRTLQQRGEQKKKTFGGALAATTPRPRSALVSQSARMYSRQVSPRASLKRVVA
jgi:hypothetical protein